MGEAAARRVRFLPGVAWSLVAAVTAAFFFTTIWPVLANASDNMLKNDLMAGYRGRIWLWQVVQLSWCSLAAFLTWGMISLGLRAAAGSPRRPSEPARPAA